MIVKLSSPAQTKNLVGFNVLPSVGMELTKAKDALLLSNPIMVAISGKDAGMPLEAGILPTNKPIRLIFGHTIGAKYNLLVSPTAALIGMPVSISYASFYPARTDGQVSIILVAHKQCEIMASLPLLALSVME